MYHGDLIGFGPVGELSDQVLEVVHTQQAVLVCVVFPEKEPHGVDVFQAEARDTGIVHFL